MTSPPRRRLLTLALGWVSLCAPVAATTLPAPFAAQEGPSARKLADASRTPELGQPDWPSEPLTDAITPAVDAGIAERLDALVARVATLEMQRDAQAARKDDLERRLARAATTGHEGSSVRINGRIHFDTWAFPGDSPGVNGFESGNPDVSPQDRVGFRRVRVDVNGELPRSMVYKFEIELAGAEDSEFRDVYLGWDDLPWLRRLLIGNQKRPYGLDHINSSRFNVFLERPWIIEAFNRDARRLGVQSYGVSDDLSWNWRYGVFNQRLVQDEGLYTSDHWQAQVAGRLARTAWYDAASDGRGYLHLALAGTWADTDEDAATDNFAGSGVSEARFSNRPESRTDSRWLDTGVLLGADDYTLLAAEAVLNLGPWQLVAEQQNVLVDRVGAEGLYLHGGYAYVSYFLTGEHIPWNRESGQLGRVVPRCDFLRRRGRCGTQRLGPGAWQIAARWSYADFADRDVRGGDAQSVTLALSWYWTPYAKVQTEWQYGRVEDNDLNAAPGAPNSGDYRVLGARFVCDF